MNVMEKLEKLMENYICENCLGRQYSRLSRGLTNFQRGRILKLLEESKNIGRCYVCNGFFDGLDKWVDRAERKLKNIEFNSLLVGTKLSKDLIEREERLWEKIGIENTEPLKAEINREVGKRLGAYFKKPAEFKNPDIVVILNLEKNDVEVKINPLFISGYYKKLQRGFPQSKWGTPGKYKTSIEEIIAKPIVKAMRGENQKLHGAGREDVDARCLDWRPFVIEILNAKKRKINLKQIERSIKKTRKVEVKNLKFSTMDVVRKIKDAKPDKTYRVLIEFSEHVGNKDLKKLKNLVGMIHQQTPERVLHRRADLLRKREVKSIKYKIKNRKAIELVVRGSAGLYIKELVTGDNSRTKPSVSELLDVKAVPKELDVIKIEKITL